MSLLPPAAMFNDHINSSFTPTHLRSHSFHELLNQVKSSVANPSNPSYVKKRSHSDLLHESSDQFDYPGTNKRSRTAPPSPPYEFSPLHTFSSTSEDKKSHTLISEASRSKSLSPNKKFLNPLSPSSSPQAATTTLPVIEKLNTKSDTDSSFNSTKIKLPSISTALNLPLKSITPTVSLDYFDTYKPNDENWRFELLDTINKKSRFFHLNQYNYLNSHSSPLSSTSSSSLASYSLKPNFDSRISSKITKHPTLLPSVKQPHYERKINFPYESNYTYLNKTYLNDVAKYPEYLELAQSLIQLSRPSQHRTPSHSHTSPQQHSQEVTEATSPQQTPQQNYHGYSAVSPTGFQIPTMAIHAPPPINTVLTNPPSFYSRKESSSYITQPHSLSGSDIPASTPVTSMSHRFIPITPPSSTKAKSRSELLKSPPKQHSHNPRVCISCGADQSPCWRPSWSIKEGQLCNSCGLRYKKTSARCLNSNCKKIPAKGEWSLMQSKGEVQFEDGIDGYSCLECGWRVEVKRGIN
ncbi:uncharacterized protein RJT21DRAFT_5785 [Scheffersomyces amazonensis]|uniref:uncharacterized protein n=1 Tax=Scheffersomyces amazonensis TaxID=1078765 RepID=UPI00315CFE4E